MSATLKLAPDPKLLDQKTDIYTLGGAKIWKS